MYFFSKFTYNEYIGPYFFIARSSMIFASEPEHSPNPLPPPKPKDSEVHHLLWNQCFKD
jgi:hypothetical protein